MWTDMGDDFCDVRGEEEETEEKRRPFLMGDGEV